MPINKSDYPPNWPEISNQVKEDAGWCCEWCQAPHMAIIQRNRPNDLPGWTTVLYIDETGIGIVSTDTLTWSRLRFHGLTKVILTTEHLDRNTKNNDSDNLAALCQRCHLSHDILQHVANRKYGRRHNKQHQLKLKIETMAYKYKYLRVTQKPKDGGLLIRRIDVSHLNKKGREIEWDKLDKEYPPDQYVSCYETAQMELPLK